MYAYRGSRDAGRTRIMRVIKVSECPPQLSVQFYCVVLVICRNLPRDTLRLHYTRLFPDPRFLLFVLQNIAGYKNAVECLLQ